MRARGANVTDIVVLVVAADDGVMPQTEEAIRHAQAAEVPIIVALNKIDRPEANPDRVTQELSKFGLMPEAWGGETLFVQTSAIKRTGLDELLEAILLQADVMDLRADPECNAVAVVVEARLDKGRGPVATLLVQHGVLRRGDPVVAGIHPGRVRAMVDYTGQAVSEAGPSDAVEIIGLDGVPEAGDSCNELDTAEAARDVAAHRAGQQRTQSQGGSAQMSLEQLMQQLHGEEAVRLNLVLKADVQGSVEAVKNALLKLSSDKVEVKILLAGVGAIKESDIMLASASRGLVLGFNVRPDANARQIAQREGVEIRTYNIIYEMLDEVQLAMAGLLAPESKEQVVGRAEVRDTFKISKVGTIAGCRVVDGKVHRAARVRLLRNSIQIFDGKVSSLRHFKDDVREVDSGNECGVSLEGYHDLKQNDVLEFYEIKEVLAEQLGSNYGARA
jgi:translation initiation factor IF-2